MNRFERWFARTFLHFESTGRAVTPCPYIGKCAEEQVMCYSCKHNLYHIESHYEPATTRRD